MRFSVWPSSANTWEDTLNVAKHAEATGWDGVWFADHFMPNQADTSGPTAEAWTTIAALSALVPRVRIGTLVTGNTYRHPAVLAKMAAQCDVISGGRIVLGLGSGWQENEHAAYGLEFSTVPGRLKRLEEACQVIKGLTTSLKTDFDGKFYQLKDAPLNPRPVQNPLPLLIGGGGEHVTLKITAKYADEWNVWGTPETLRNKMAILDAHCDKIGRPRTAIQRSAVALLVLTDDAEQVERMKAAGRPLIAGNAAQVRDIIAEYRDAGVSEVIIPDFNLGRGEKKIEAYDAFMNDIVPAFR